MGIYIPNMQMPKDDPVIIKICSDGTVSRIHSGVAATAIPVPPHGRLIDADKLFRVIGQDERFSVLEAMYVQSLITAAPTIIPEEHIGDANQMVNNDYAGLKVKYIVRKASNGELVDDCFVLRPDRDQAAIAALNAYADATENQVLAADIRKWLSSKISAEPRVIKWREWNRIGAEEG